MYFSIEYNFSLEYMSCCRIPKDKLSFFYLIFQGQITLMDVPVFKAIQPDVSSFKNFPSKYTEWLLIVSQNKF